MPVSDEAVKAAADAAHKEALAMINQTGATSREVSVNGLSVGNYRIMRAALEAAEVVREREKFGVQQTRCKLCSGPHDNGLLSDICRQCEDRAPWRDDYKLSGGNHD